MSVNPYELIARAAAKKYGIDPDVYARQIKRESGFQPRVGSPAGAQGIAQIMPATARSWGVDPNDPRAALDAAAKHMAGYVKSYGGDYSKALAAYNAGPGAVAKYGGVPPYRETQAYVRNILRGVNPGGSGGKIPALTDAASTGLDPSRLSAMSLLFDDDPTFAGLLASKMQQDGAASNPVPRGPQTAIQGSTAAGFGSGVKAIEAFGRKFGLTPGSTTGGKHAPGSYHYQGKAVDFGDATNSRSSLLATMNYLRQHPQGVLEAFYDPSGYYVKNGKVHQGAFGGHGDHLHIAE